VLFTRYYIAAHGDGFAKFPSLFTIGPENMPEKEM
jgi:hypothetical protein